jgi:hypothetical protein
MGNTSTIKLTSGAVKLTQTTNYPWEGRVDLQVDPVKSSAFTVNIRIPGWAQQMPAPSDLYHFMDMKKKPVVITLNGKSVQYEINKGYAVLKRTWKKGDKISIDFPMEPQKVIANEKVKDDAGRFALQRGPIVYCLEGPDNKDSLVQNILVTKDAPVQAVYKQNFMDGVTILTTNGSSAKRQLNSDVLLKSEQEVVAIPYYTWANRGPNEMMVWIPYEESAARPKPAPTIAATSKVVSSSKNTRSYMALNDQIEPMNSVDQNNTYLHWWPKNNSREFVQYNFEKEATVSESEVYWYDDGPFGGCRIPASYKIYYKKGEEWVPVNNTTQYELAKDKFNVVKFEPVKTTALKLEVQLPENHSTGIHEWKIK